ncbi:hypothetical protein GEMRC1_009796 [Eukaryota sp. GEM-RC1]
MSITQKRIVIRGIHPSLDEQSFLNLVQPALSKFHVDHVSFIQKHCLYPNVGARCFITFSKADSIIPFGHELSKIKTFGNPQCKSLGIEFAPSQMIPRKMFPDSFIGTLCPELNPVYSSFLRSVEQEKEPSEVLSFAQLSELAKKRETDGTGQKNEALLDAILSKSNNFSNKKQGKTLPKKVVPVPIPSPKSAPRRNRRNKKQPKAEGGGDTGKTVAPNAAPNNNSNNNNNSKRRDNLRGNRHRFSVCDLIVHCRDLCLFSSMSSLISSFAEGIIPLIGFDLILLKEVVWVSV